VDKLTPNKGVFMSTFRNSAKALIFAAALGGCVSTTGHGQQSQQPRARIAYALAQTYYEVSLVSSDTQLEMQVRGPLFDASLDHVHHLDMNHSAFASDRFEIDRDENNMLELVTLQSRGRANAVAYNIGASLGAVSSTSGGAPQGPRTEGADTQAEPPRETQLLGAIWRPSATPAETADLQRRLNAVIASWFAASCDRRGVCAPAQAPTIALSAALAAAATTTPAPDCRRVICYSGQARATLQIEVAPAPQPAAAPSPQPARGRAPTAPARVSRVVDADLGAARSITIVDAAVSPSSVEFVDPSMTALGGGTMQLAFQRGALSYVAFARQSEVEAVALLPYDFVRGAANALYSVLPIRVAIEYQRRQLDTVTSAATPTAPTAPASMSVPSITNTGEAPPDAATAPTTTMLETRTQEVREFVLARREGAAERGAGTGGGGATGRSTTPTTPRRD
jgi:hypothetical protein